MKAVEGMSGAAVIYTAFATLLTCFLGGITAFAILAILLDLLFCAAMVAIAVLTRGGRHTKGQYSPLGNRKARDAKFQTAVFAISIIAAFLFLITAVMAVLLMRHHKKEKSYGPSPSNNYTSGKGKTPIWKRNKKSHRDAEELGAVGAGSVLIAEEKHKKNHDLRPSHETGMTGSTAAAPEVYGGSANKYVEPAVPTQTYGGTPNKYAEPAVPTHHNTNSGYEPYTQQQTGTVGTATDGTYGGYGNTTGEHRHHGATNVIHDPNPYAEVHNNGFVHQEKSKY